MIPVVDVDLSLPGSWEEAFAPHKRSMKALLTALDKDVEAKVGSMALWGLKKAIGLGGALFGNVHGDECEELASVAGVNASDIRAANLAYDLSHAGCSTLAVPADSGRGAVLARNLDWELGSPTLMKRTLVVARVTGAPAGDYISVLWPGLFGGLTAMAPGRFSLAINHVVHADANAVTGLLSGAMPCTWATRHALDQCRTFDAAVKYLRSVELAAPVLITVAGTKPEDRVVIERSQYSAAVRKAPVAGAPVMVTNHYLGRKFHGSNASPRDFLDDSVGRHAGVEAGLADCAHTPAGLFKVLTREDVLRYDTQYQVVMDARAGVLHCRTLGGRAQKVRMQALA